MKIDFKTVAIVLLLCMIGMQSLITAQAIDRATQCKIEAIDRAAQCKADAIECKMEVME